MCTYVEQKDGLYGTSAAWKNLANRQLETSQWTQESRNENTDFLKKISTF